MRKAVGVDLYNQSITYDVSKTLNSKASDSDHVPCVIVNSSVISESITSYGVVSKGNGEAFVMKEKHTSLSIGGGQAGQGYPCVLINSSGGGISGTLDSSYYKGQGERQGIEREYVVIHGSYSRRERYYSKS